MVGSRADFGLRPKERGANEPAGNQGMVVAEERVGQLQQFPTIVIDL